MNKVSFLLVVFVFFLGQTGICITPLIDSPGKTFGSDFNGDGIHDIIIGAYQNDAGANNAGAAFVFFGANNLAGTIDISATSSADLSILGKVASDELGRGVASAGDINGDGIDDIIVGARGNDDAGELNPGAAYIFFGSTTLSGTKNLGGGQSADVTILGKDPPGGIESARLGIAVSSAGDVNGDGFDDVIIGAYNDSYPGVANYVGAAYIFFGAADISGTKNLTAVESADLSIWGKAGSDQLASYLSGAGDINGDGFDDVIAGARNNDDGGANAGAAYVIYGSSTLTGTVNLGGGPLSADITIFGKVDADEFGLFSSGLGDVNGDGLDDFIVGARFNDDAANSAGAAYVFLGATNLSGTKDLGGGQSADVTILGKAAIDRLSQGVGSAGDINDDGYDEILVGAYRNDDGTGFNNNPGAAYVFFGSSSINGTKRLGGGESADLTVLGPGGYVYTGRAVEGIGDMNADGIADLAIGSDNNVYIFFGATNLSGTKDTGTSDEDVRFTGGGDRFGRNLGGGRDNHSP